MKEWTIVAAALILFAVSGSILKKFDAFLHAANGFPH